MSETSSRLQQQLDALLQRVSAVVTNTADTALAEKFNIPLALISDLRRRALSEEHLSGAQVQKLLAAVQSLYNVTSATLLHETTGMVGSACSVYCPLCGKEKGMSNPVVRIITCAQCGQGMKVSLRLVASVYP